MTLRLKKLPIKEIDNEQQRSIQAIQEAFRRIEEYINSDQIGSGPQGPRGPAGPNGLQGPIGPIGPQGIPGTSGATIEDSYLAGATIASLKVLYSEDNTDVLVYTSSIDKYPFGVAVGGASIGNPITVRKFGVLQDAALSLTPQQPVYVDATGSLTQTAPTVGYLIEIGHAVASDAIMINIKQRVTL